MRSCPESTSALTELSEELCQMKMRRILKVVLESEESIQQEKANFADDGSTAFVTRDMKSDYTTSLVALTE